jgi:homoserine dehydrogenase
MMLDLAFIGFGNVARRFVGMMDEKARLLKSRYGFACRTVAICTRRHGAVINPGGLDAARAVEIVESGGSLDMLSGERTSVLAPCGLRAVDGLKKAAPSALEQGRLVVIETTVLDVRNGEPATGHVRAALESGAHVVTANKAPVAFAYGELRGLATRQNRMFLFEGAVMDGIPVFNLWRETLPAITVTGFRGVVNSTTNHVLDRMEAGASFFEALAEMQGAGIAEADPSLDVDGWDAAAKAAALINVLMNGNVTPLSIARTGIAGIDTARVRAVRARGRRLRLVARGERRESVIVGSVAPIELPGDDLLAGLEGTRNGLIIDTDLLGSVAVLQLDSGLTQTAYALLTDLLHLHGALCGGRPRALAAED